MIVATCYHSLFGSLVAGHLNARPQQSIGAVIAALRRRVTGEHTRRLCTPPNPVHRKIFMLIIIVCVVFMVLWPGMTRWLPPKSKGVPDTHPRRVKRNVDPRPDLPMESSWVHEFET
jgi:hypothetical protein